MSTLVRQIALVSQSTLISGRDLSKVAAAIQKQATRDLSPIWNVSATVDAFDNLDDVPIGYWPLVVMDNVKAPGASGIHEDNNGQPFALISASADLDIWSLTASHEALEMLVDPFGRRMVAGDALPDSGQVRVSYLVEVCDPCESAEFAYSSNGIRVSDFYTPRYFDPTSSDGVQYSFTGAVKGPRQILIGGYLSWQDPETGIWWQATNFDGAKAIRQLGQLDLTGGKSARSLIDAMTTGETAKTMARPRAMSLLAGHAPAAVAKSTSARAAMWRRNINQIIGGEALQSARDPSPACREPITRGGRRSASALRADLRRGSGDAARPVCRGRLYDVRRQSRQPFAPSEHQLPIGLPLAGRNSDGRFHNRQHGSNVLRVCRAAAD